MTFSLWSAAGALIGATLGYINWRVIMGILEPRLRKLNNAESATERAVFEDKIVLLRRIFLILEIAILGAVGWFAGELFGG